MRRFLFVGVAVLWHAVASSQGAADLLLLDADPIADINNTIRINRVMRAGRWVQ
jgi:hypothetical protein